MPTVTVPPAARLALAAVLVTTVAACGTGSAISSPSPVTASLAVASPTAATSPSEAPLTPAPSLTPVPGGQSTAPDPVGTRIPTTQTDWGEILDALPDSFPMYPGADVAEVPDEVVSGSFEAPADVDTVVAWYTQQLSERGYSVDTGDALEDGSRVMDVSADLPECRLQLGFHPAEESTIMTVLIASACVNGTG